MKTLVIREFDHYPIESIYELDLTNTIKDCIGCWNCWIKTPGICAHQDLNVFYSKYIEVDKVIIFSKITKGFVCGNLKTLFDRMIPLFLPYVEVSTGESRHVPRYDKYPDIEFYYKGNFETGEGKDVFEDYIFRTFDQFASKDIIIKPIEGYKN